MANRKTTTAVKRVAKRAATAPQPAQQLAQFVSQTKEPKLYMRCFKYHQRHPEMSYADISRMYRQEGGPLADAMSKRLGRDVAHRVQKIMRSAKVDEKTALEMDEERHVRYGGIPYFRYIRIKTYLASHPEDEGKSIDELWTLHQKEGARKRLRRCLESNRGYFRASMRLSYYRKHGNKTMARKMLALRNSFRKTKGHR